MSDFVGLRVKLVDRLVVLVGTVFEALCSITCLTLLCVLPTSLLVSDALMGISTPPDAPDNGTSLYRVMIYVALVQWATPPIAVLSVGFAVMLLLRQTASTVADMDADFACSLLARQRTERNVEAAAAADRLAASKARGEKIDPALSEGRAKPLREAKKDFAIKVEGDRHVVVGKATEGTPGAGGEGAPAPAAAPSGSNDDNGDADNYEDASGLTVDSPPAEVYLSMEREDFVRAWDMSKRDLEDAVGTLSSNVTVCLQLITLGAAVVTALLVVIFGITQPLIQRILVGALMGLTVPWCYGLGALTTPARTYGLLVLAETASIVNVVLGVDLAPPEAARSRAADGENPGDKSPTKAQIKGQEAKKRLEELRLGAKIHVAPAKTQVAPADADPASPAGSALRGRKAQAGADALP